MKYQITGYQVIYRNGNRDNIKPLRSIETDNIETVRKQIIKEKGAEYVNLSYTEINKKRQWKRIRIWNCTTE